MSQLLKARLVPYMADEQGNSDRDKTLPKVPCCCLALEEDGASLPTYLPR